jgi:hypothetical protein
VGVRHASIVRVTAKMVVEWHRVNVMSARNHGAARLTFGIDRVPDDIDERF